LNCDPLTQRTNYSYLNDGALGSSWSGAGIRTFGLQTHTPATIEKPRDLEFWSHSSAPATTEVIYSTVNCSIRMTHVEATFSCQGLTCLAESIRGISDPSSNITFVEGVAGLNFLSSFGASQVLSQSGRSTMTEAYIYNSSLPTVKLLVAEPYVNIFEIPTSDFERRLAQVLNTYWIAGQATFYLSGSLPSNLSEFASVNASSNELPNSSAWPELFQANSTIGDPLLRQEVYLANIGWLVLAFISSIVLIILRFATFYLQRQILTTPTS